MKTDPLIDHKRIEGIGGFSNPAIRQTIDNFISDLPSYLFMLNTLNQQKNAEGIGIILHKLKGASMTCGFTAIGKCVVEWDSQIDSFDAKSYERLRGIVDASILDWKKLT